MAAGTKGTVIQVIGSTFDAQFPEDQLPAIYNAIEVTLDQDGQAVKLYGEIQQHLGGGVVRAVALGSTDGMRRGMEMIDTGGSRHRPGRRGSPRPRLQPPRPADRQQAIARQRRAQADPPRSTRVRPAQPKDRNPPNRHQGHRPPLPVRSRRQDRPLRWCGCGQDRDHPGNDRTRRP